jgi:hypothetical protein
MERIGIALTVAAVAGLIAWPGLGAVIGAAAVPAAVLLGAGAGWLSWRRLPGSVDGAFRRRRTAAILWSLLAVVTVVQTARLGAYMEDPSRDWWLTTKDAFWSKHMCMVAYFYAADLNRQGEPNVYDGNLYPGLNPRAESRATVENLVPEDPYQYPPQFLLAPRLAIAMSNDFFRIRPVWYALQAGLFLLVAFLLARWYGGAAGKPALFLIPAVWISVPSMLNFQYGQFHLTTIVLAMAAFLAFETRRHALGGGLLAASILAKGFPGILIVPLLLQRRWRAAAWTGAWAAGLTVLAWGVLGPEPFEAFFRYHLPRVQNGAAFAFEEAWPELRAALRAGNISPFALARKLGDLGVPRATDHLARVVQTVFSVAVLGIAVVAARIRDARPRALSWLALLTLAAMTSPASWGDYVPVGTLWMVTLTAAGRTRLRPAVWGGVAVLSFLLPGVVPIGSFPPPPASMILSILGSLVWIGINAWIVIREVGVPVRVPVSDAWKYNSRVPST